MFKVIDYQDRYIDEFAYRGEEEELLNKMDIKKMIKHYASIGDCWIGVNSDNPIMFGGVYQVHQGVGQGWLLMSPQCSKWTKQIVKETRKRIDDVIKTNNFHRLQTLAMPHNKKVVKFLELIGFNKEATLKKFTQEGKDMAIYTILRGDR